MAAGGLRALAAKLKSDKYRSGLIARAAKREIDRVHRANEEALSTKLAPPRVEVDGRRGAALSTVKPNGRIVASWNTETDAVRWCLNEVRRASPVLTGAYEQSHRLFCDGVEHEGDGPIPPAGEYIITSSAPYARKIEGGSSSQAPNGVYEAVAAVALTRFGDDARIYFGWSDAPGTTASWPARRDRVRSRRQAAELRFPAIFIYPE